MDPKVETLETERARLLARLGQTGDMRRGALAETYRSCGKEACGCQSPDHPGHGPYYVLTSKSKGKTKALHVKRGPMLEKIEREVEAYKTFRSTCTELVDVNEKICERRPWEKTEEEVEKAEVKKKSRRRSKKR